MVQIEDTNSSFISQLKTAYLTLGLKTWVTKIFHIICIFHHFNFDAEPPSPPPLVSKNYLHEFEESLDLHAFGYPMSLRFWISWLCQKSPQSQGSTEITSCLMGKENYSIANTKFKRKYSSVQRDTPWPLLQKINFIQQRTAWLQHVGLRFCRKRWW